MNKKVITYAILSLFLLSIIGIASAETIEIDASSYSIWDNFLHKLQKIGLFTAAGQERECSIEVDYIVTGVSGYVSTPSLLSSANCDVALFNVYDKDYHFIAEYRSEDIGGFQIASASTVVDYPAIIEVYCCPYEACDSNADCSVSPASSYGDTCNTIYGSCYGEAPTHTTPIMKCINDNWVNYDTAYYGDSDWCLEGRSNWIDRDGDTHSCREPTYSSVVDGTWCGVIDDVVDDGDDGNGDEEITTCSDLSMLNCKERTDCVYTKTVPFCEDLTSATCDEIYYETGCDKKSTCEWTGLTCKVKDSLDDAVLSGIITDIQLFKNTFQQGEEVDVRFRVKNQGDEGYYLIETGIIPKSVAKDWGFVSDTGLFSFWHFTTSTECCEGQPNIFAKTVYFENEETHEIQIDIPKAPYNGISDLCYDNDYWDGEGEYVLYVIMKTGCYPDGENVVYETIGLNINDTDDGDDTITPAISMTWTEFYSMDDNTFTKKAKGLGCNSVTDCPSKEGYTIICDDNEQFSDRLYEVSVASCDDNFGIIDELLTIGMLGLGSGSYCEQVVDLWGSQGTAVSFLEWIGLKAESPKGYCIAESNTWYGSLWESTLKAMGGMGLPTQYVMIITIMLLITGVGFGMRAVMG